MNDSATAVKLAKPQLSNIARKLESVARKLDSVMTELTTEPMCILDWNYRDIAKLQIRDIADANKDIAIRVERIEEIIRHIQGKE